MQDNVLMFNFMADYVYGSDSRFISIMSTHLGGEITRTADS